MTLRDSPADEVPGMRGGRRRSKFPWRALARDKFAAASFLWICLIVLACVLGPILSPYDVSGRRLDHALLPPFTTKDGNFYMFGTDGIGRDMLTRILDGGRISLGLALTVAIISGTIGVLLGVVSGYYRGWVDDVIMRVVDVFMALPTVFFVLMALYIFGTTTLNLILVMSVARWMLYCRVVRGLTLSMREQTFIVATRTLGASNARVMVRHLLPNMLSTIFTIGTVDIARVVLLESSISFLGLGLQAPAVSWGLLISDGRSYITNAWWLISWPGLFIFLTALSINMFGLWLRMINDPLHKWRYLR